MTSIWFFFFLMIRRPPRSTLFPYTTSSDLLRRATRLLRGGCDVVLAPAEGGGYALIGARRVSRRLFDGIAWGERDRKSTRLNSSHGYISYAVFCLKKKTQHATAVPDAQRAH